MGIAVDTVGFSAAVAGAAGKAATPATGTSFTVRNFPQTATARLVDLFRQDASTTVGFVQLKSSRLANDTTGIKVVTAETPSVALLPPGANQGLYSGDNLAVNVSGDATATTHTAGAFSVYYSTLPGASARLHSWGDVSGAIANIFTQNVALDAATVGAWKDQLANTTADLMRADTTYALLGYATSLAYACVGLRSQETGTLRICGPGTTNAEDTTNYFVDRSNALGLPFIPVVNANNRGNIKATAIAGLAASGIITLIWGQLSAPVS